MANNVCIEPDLHVNKDPMFDINSRLLLAFWNWSRKPTADLVNTHETLLPPRGGFSVQRH